MSSQIFHDKEPTFGLGEGSKIWPDDFNLVAAVASDDLDEIFGLTNHVNGDWTKNKGVKALVKTARSTSVGDIVVVDDAVYICLFVGWMDLGKADKKIIVPRMLGNSQ
jgi:hypothetical protein